MECDFKNCMFWIGNGCIDEEEQLTCPYMNILKDIHKVQKSLEKAYQVIGEMIE